MNMGKYMKKLLGIIICLYLSYLSFNLYQSYCHLYKAITYLNQNDTPKAIKELRIASRQCPYNIISRYYLAGLLAQSDPIQALRLYEEVESKNPNFLLTNYYKSLIYHDLKLYNQAYREICKAERLYPLNDIIQQEKQKYRIERK